MTEVTTNSTTSPPEPEHRAQRRRLEKEARRQAQYEKSKFYSRDLGYRLPRSVFSDRVLRDPKDQSKGTRPFTVKELEQRAAKRGKRHPNGSPFLLPPYNPKDRKPQPYNNNPKKREARALMKHNIRREREIGTDSKYGNRYPEAFKQTIIDLLESGTIIPVYKERKKEWDKANPFEEPTNG